MTGTPDRRPSVSLVATMLNEVDSLPALLASIDVQTLPPAEVVIVDGGSADGTFRALLSWAEGRPGAVVLQAPGSNIAAGRNFAIGQAGGEIIAVTDAGVTLEPTWLERITAPLASDPAVDVVCGFFVPEVDGAFQLALGATVLPCAEEIDPEAFLPSSRSVAFRKSAWATVGGYPEWLDYCEDLVFDLALRRAGCRFAWAPDATVRFRPRPNLGAFFRQYFLYARGDGKADLWRRRHAIRYGVYLLAPILAWRLRRSPLALAAAAGLGGLYLHGPIQRIILMRATGGRRWTSQLVSALALIPVIRIVGDVAKMVGYPLGVLWRLQNPPPQPSPAPPFPLRERGDGEARVPPLTESPTLDLSIIIVNYNTREHLRSCLRSVQASVGVAPLETYVVDNGSADGSADTVQADFPWVHLIRSSANLGYARANNLALRRAGGRCLLLLNPDTEVGPTALRDMLAYLEAHPEAGAAGPKLVRADGSLDLACRRSFPTPSVAFYRLVGLTRLFPRSRRFGRYNLTYLDPDVETEVDALAGAFMLVRREAVEMVGLLDEGFFMYGEDLDWAYRIKGQGWRIRYNPRVSVLHHKGESSRQSSTRATIAFFQAMRRFYEKHYRSETFVLLDWLIIATIYSRLAWALLRNSLRPPERRRVAA